MSKVSVKDLVVFVTGASREKGIGQALVKEAIKRGAKKVYATARDLSQLDDLSSEVVPLELDVANLEQIKQVAEIASDTQLLINNAGYSGLCGCMYNYNEDVARREFEVNFFGPLYLMHFFSNNLVKNTHSAILNVISIAAFMPFSLVATYSASKAALHSLTQTVRTEMHQHNIPVFGAYPGPIDTDMAKGIDVEKATSKSCAIRIFDAMEQGELDITTDTLADAFRGYLKKDPEAFEAVKKTFGLGHYHSKNGKAL